MSAELGEKQFKVFKYLAANPDKSISEIQEALGDNHPTLISKPVKALRDARLIIESSTYKMKGTIINRYELNELGVSYALFTFTSEECKTVMKNYGDKYPGVKNQYRVFLDLDQVLGPKYQDFREGFLKRLRKTIVLFSEAGYHGDEAIALIQNIFAIEFNRINLTKGEKNKLRKRAKLYPTVNMADQAKEFRKFRSRYPI